LSTGTQFVKIGFEIAKKFQEDKIKASDYKIDIVRNGYKIPFLRLLVLIK